MIVIPGYCSFPDQLFEKLALLTDGKSADRTGQRGGRVAHEIAERSGGETACLAELSIGHELLLDEG